MRRQARQGRRGRRPGQRRLRRWRRCRRSRRVVVRHAGHRQVEAVDRLLQGLDVVREVLDHPQEFVGGARAVRHLRHLVVGVRGPGRRRPVRRRRPGRRSRPRRRRRRRRHPRGGRRPRGDAVAHRAHEVRPPFPALGHGPPGQRRQHTELRLVRVAVEAAPFREQGQRHVLARVPGPRPRRGRASFSLARTPPLRRRPFPFHGRAARARHARPGAASVSGCRPSPAISTRPDPARTAAVAIRCKIKMTDKLTDRLKFNNLKSRIPRSRVVPRPPHHS